MAGFIPEHPDVSAQSTTDPSLLRRLPDSPEVRNESGLQPSVKHELQVLRNDLHIEDQENVPPAPDSDSLLRNEGTSVQAESELLGSDDVQSRTSSQQGLQSQTSSTPSTDTAVEAQEVTGKDESDALTGLPPSSFSKTDDSQSPHPTKVSSEGASATTVYFSPKPTVLVEEERSSAVCDDIEVPRKKIPVTPSDWDFSFKEEDRSVINADLKSLLKGVSGWTEMKGFGPGYSKEDILDYLVLNNKLNRHGFGSEWCVGCGQMKVTPESKKERPESHIWPKCLLKLAGRVHRPHVTNFILNVRSGERMGAGGPTVKLLCSKCEGEHSKEENKLRALYLKLLLKQGTENVNWMRKVLVKVLFLGIMVNSDLKKELQDKDKQFEVEFMTLWMYLATKGKQTKDTEPLPVPDVRLFLLPSDSPCGDLVAKHKYKAFRNLSFTSIVRRSGAVFLYTQLDIFHVVVPVNGKSRLIFDRYTNCLQSDGLRRSVCTDADVPEGIGSSASRLDKFQSFPRVLLDENKERIADLEKMNPESEKDDIVFLVDLPFRFKDKKNEANQNEAKQNKHTRKLKEDDTQLIKEASEISPFRLYHNKEENKVANLEKELYTEKQNAKIAGMEATTMKEKHEILKEEHGTLKEEHGTLKEEHGTLKEEHGTLKEEHGTLKEEHGTLKEEHGTLKEEPGALKEEHGTLKEEHGTLKEEHGTLKEEHGTLKEEHGTLKEEHGTLKEEHGTLKEEHGTLKEEHGTLKEEHGALKEEHGTLKEEHGTLKEEHETLKEEHGTLKEEHGTLKEEHGALKEEHGTLKDTEP